MTRGSSTARCGISSAASPKVVYPDADDLVVLVIDSTKVAAPVRYEAAEPGAVKYPHIYGPLPVRAVTEVVEVSRDAAGRLVLPE